RPTNSSAASTATTTAASVLTPRLMTNDPAIGQRSTFTDNVGWGVTVVGWVERLRNPSTPPSSANRITFRRTGLHSHADLPPNPAGRRPTAPADETTNMANLRPGSHGRV